MSDPIRPTPLSSPTSASMSKVSSPRKTRERELEKQADQLMGELFEDLETTLQSPLVPYQGPTAWNQYPYSSARPPLPERQGSLKWIVGAGIAALLVGGIALWSSYASLLGRLTPVAVSSASNSASNSTVTDPNALTDPPSGLNAAAPQPLVAGGTAAQSTQTDLAAAANVNANPTAPVALKTAPAITPTKPVAKPVAQSVAKPAPAAVAKPRPQLASGAKPMAAKPRSTTPIASAPVIQRSRSAPVAETVIFEPPLANATAPRTSRLVAPNVSSPGYAPEMKLVGTVGGPGSPVALILVGDVVREVPVGNTVMGGWTVRNIQRDAVTISNGNRGFTLQMGLGQTY